MSIGTVELISYQREDDREVSVYSISHDNGTTRLEQQLTLVNESRHGSDGRWVAKLDIDEFPAQMTASEAAFKLADWLERLAAVMRAGRYLSDAPSTHVDLDVAAGGE